MLTNASHLIYDTEKRLLDITIAVTAIVTLWPLLAIVALLVRLNLGSPVLFRQRRPGKQGKIFTLVKFRTMSDARDDAGRLLPDEMRLNRLGRLLRSFSVDELPELINVLRGDMSLVGPRPLLVNYLHRYTPKQAQRHHVKPGLTGWAQINGRNALSWEEKFALDVWYVNHRSVWLDLKILLRTLSVVARRVGTSSARHMTMPTFLGTALRKDLHS